MEEIILTAQRRMKTGKQVKALRRSGGLPAILYGRQSDPIPLTLDLREASHIIPTITSSHLIKIVVDGNQHNALVREKQYHPIHRNLLHVDFLQVSLTEKIRVNVVIDLEGEALAVKEQSGVLVIGLEELEVECLPQDLPERITVDITGLANIGDAIHIRDIALPETIKVISDPDEMVALITSVAEEEVEEEIKGVEEGEPEVIERGKREEGEF